MTPYQERLVLDHLYLIRNFVRAQIDERTLPPSIDEKDLLQQGALILMRAAELYRPGSAKFSTYANKCVRLALIGYIGNERWGPKESKRYAMRRNGEDRIPDMVSYDAMPTDEGGRAFLDKIALENDQAVRRVTPEMASEVLASIRKTALRKVARNSKFGGGICYVRADSNYAASVKIMGRLCQLGRFHTADSASSYRASFLKNLEELCEEIIGCVHSQRGSK